jgi:hypothetical protein
MSDRNEGWWRAERERNTNRGVVFANNSLRTSVACIARFSSTSMRFGNIVDWYDGVCFSFEVTEYFIHQLLSITQEKIFDLCRAHGRCGGKILTLSKFQVSLCINFFSNGIYHFLATDLSPSDFRVGLHCQGQTFSPV